MISEVFCRSQVKFDWNEKGEERKPLNRGDLHRAWSENRGKWDKLNSFVGLSVSEPC